MERLRKSSIWHLLVAFACVIAIQSTIQAAPKKKGKAKSDPDHVPAGELYLKVAALETLYDFDLTDEQMTALRSQAPAPDAPAPTGPMVSPKLQRSLLDLYNALVKVDEEQIEKLQDEVDQATEAEKVKPPEPALTQAARRQAPALLRQLDAGQIASYFADAADDVQDPAQFLLDTIATGRGMTGDDWDKLRAAAVEDVATLAAGLDPSAAKPMSDKAAKWLADWHAVDDDQLKARQSEMEAAARQLFAALDPMEVLRHCAERELARLLSNPQLASAIDARLAAKK